MLSLILLTHRSRNNLKHQRPIMQKHSCKILLQLASLSRYFNPYPKLPYDKAAIPVKQIDSFRKGDHGRSKSDAVNNLIHRFLSVEARSPVRFPHPGIGVYIISEWKRHGNIRDPIEKHRGCRIRKFFIQNPFRNLPEKYHPPWGASLDQDRCKGSTTSLPLSWSSHLGHYSSSRV